MQGTKYILKKTNEYEGFISEEMGKKEKYPISKNMDPLLLKGIILLLQHNII